METLQYATCNAEMPTGRLCGSAARKGNALCYHHRRHADMTARIARGGHHKDWASVNRHKPGALAEVVAEDLKKYDENLSHIVKDLNLATISDPDSIQFALDAVFQLTIMQLLPDKIAGRCIYLLQLSMQRYKLSNPRKTMADVAAEKRADEKAESEERQRRYAREKEERKAEAERIQLEKEARELEVKRKQFESLDRKRQGRMKMLIDYYQGEANIPADLIPPPTIVPGYAPPEDEAVPQGVPQPPSTAQQTQSGAAGLAAAQDLPRNLGHKPPSSAPQPEPAPMANTA